MARGVKEARQLARHFDSLLTELVKVAKERYGDQLISLVVFGSVGRGTPRVDSDVDILVVADSLPNGRLRRVEQFGAVRRALASRLSSLAKKGICTGLAPIFKTPAEVRRGSLLFLDMIEDGRILYDRGSFWKNYMDDFQARLRRLGARKIVEGDRWYWDLKPDYRPGDVFEI